MNEMSVCWPLLKLIHNASSLKPFPVEYIACNPKFNLRWRLRAQISQWSFYGSKAKRVQYKENKEREREKGTPTSRRIRRHQSRWKVNSKTFSTMVCANRYKGAPFYIFHNPDANFSARHLSRHYASFISKSSTALT